jgi:benzil reductase ((S)-benzoin forming)
MLHFYITGISGGLGKALTLHFLSEGHLVTGMSRNCSVKHESFEFIPCDLSVPQSIPQVDFDRSREIVFINNAGVIGNVKRLSEQPEPDCIEVMNINALSPMLLCHQLLAHTPLHQAITIVNISSGAGSRSIPGWASYCASKSALDRFSETLYKEELERGRQIRVYSLSPGVIDTAMQDRIRQATSLEFSSAETFAELQKNNELQQPETVAAVIANMLSMPFSGQVICSLKDFM